MELSPTPKQSEPVGPLIGVIIIVLVFVAGGIYFLLMEQEKAAEPVEQGQTSNL